MLAIIVLLEHSHHTVCIAGTATGKQGKLKLSYAQPGN